MKSDKIIGPSKELRERMEQLRQMRPPSLETVERQFRAAKAHHEKYGYTGGKLKSRRDKLGTNENGRSGREQRRA